MYEIGISEIKCTKRLEDKDGYSIKYEAEAVARPLKCRNEDCKHTIKAHIHSTKHKLLFDVRAEGKLVYIDLSIRRYRCPDCGHVFPDEFTFFDKNSKLTNRLKDEFINRVINGETFSYIARDYSVDRKTVSAVFNEYAAAHIEELTYDYTPVILGIDEAHIDDNYRLVLTDIKEQRLLDIKRDNKARTIRKYLYTLDASVCEAATMDFAPAYAKAVSSVLPETTIVIDKFHVVQELNRALDKVRILLQNRYREEGCSMRHFKHSKRLFMMNFEDLDDNARDCMNDWFIKHEELYEAYMTKEMFRDIYARAKTIADASHMFDIWTDTVPDFPPFQAALRTFIRRKAHILNYFQYPWTNAYTESVNNQIKKIEKAGRGYKFDTLRTRCILEINRTIPKPFNPRTASYVEYKINPPEPMGVRERAALYDSIPRAIVKQQLNNSDAVDYMITAKGKDNEPLDVLLEHIPHNKYGFIRRMRAYHDALETLRGRSD